ncbi:rSAM-modified peptide [Flavobacterium anhuiense]|uniref:rSAM-modified peptide n=1 Tax=Flavobacterium anhuiense TaxID=459526 RepID=UPI002025F01E|nr:rSAM-modified peptide [Flavobacterium anhuiense]URM38104.1 rSAM-modified peptide [Flavobacterium anhuiense]
MKNIKSKFSDFELMTITKQQQKTVRGGGESGEDGIDPNKHDPKNGGGGNGTG